MGTGTHKDKVTAAFKELRKLGYVCRQRFTCCAGCGSYDLATLIKERGGDPNTAKVVWYHRQDAEAFDGEMLTRNLMLRWNGDAAEIKQTLEAQGLLVIHDGSIERCIEVACFDMYTRRLAARVVNNLRARGRLPEGQSPNRPDLDEVIAIVATQLAASGVSAESAR